MFLSCFRDPDGNTIPKSEKTLYVSFDEDSLNARKDRDRSLGALSVSQVQRYYFITHSDGLRIPFKKRLHFPGSNKGESIYGVKAPLWSDNSVTWTLTYAEKKELYGRNRIAVGGANIADEGASNSRRADSDIEAAFFHATPSELTDEIVHCYNISAIIDLTPGKVVNATWLFSIKSFISLVWLTYFFHHLSGPGTAAMVAIRRRIPYVGLCFTHKHVT